MANQIKYDVKFNVDSSGLARMKSALQQISTLNKSLSNSDVAKAMGISAKEATSSFIKIKEQIMNVEKALKSAFNAKLDTVNIETFNRVLKESGSSMDQVYAAFKNAGSAGIATFNSISSSVLNTNIQLRQSHTLLDKMATTLGNTIKWNAASSVVNGLTRSVEQAWGYVKNLDSSLNDIRVVTGKSADEMANFAKQANAAAQSLGRTTTDYTKAALIYAQQGLSDEQIARRSEITLKTANVTGQSTQAVSEELTAVWNGYKVSAEEAELYVDRLAAVAATTASDLEELSTGMSKVASAAAAMGVGQDQLAAQLSTIISVTRQAPESVGTALRTVYARISDIKAGIDEDGVTLGNYSGKMAELGFNVLDAAGNLRDMGQVMEEIGGRWQDLTREQQINLAQTMAGQRQYSNLIALFDNFESYNKALATAQNAEGTLAQQQDIAMERTTAHLNILKASVENIYDSLVDTKPINDLIDGLSTVANKTATVIDGFGGGIPILKSLGAIGLSVFSTQIARGINTTVINLETARNNALQFSQALESTRNVLKIQGLDETSDKLLKAREQMLQLSKVMTPEQFSGIQNLLNDLTKAENEVLKFKGQIKDLSNDLQKLGVNQDFNEVANNDVLKNSIDEKISAYQDLNENIEAYQQLVRDMPEEKLGENASIKTLIEDLKTLQDSQIITKEKFEQLKKAFDDANQVGASQDQVINFYEKLDAALEELKPKLDPATFEKLSAALHGDFSQAADEATEKVRTLSETFSDAMDRMFNAQKLKNFTDTVGAIGRIGSGISQLKNLGGIWNKEDVSIGDKILQTLTSIGFALPMVVSGVKSLGAALSLTGKTLSAFNGIAIAFTTITTVIGFVNSALKQHQENLRKQKEQAIETQNKLQQQIIKQEQLCKSLDDLNEKTQNGELSRADLRSEIDELVKSYDIEDERIKQLKGTYEETTKAIRQMREQALTSKEESTATELENARGLVWNKNKNIGVGTAEWRDYDNGKYNLTLSESAQYDDQNIRQTMMSILKNSSLYTQIAGEEFDPNAEDPYASFSQVALSTEDSVEGFISLYEELLRIQEQASKQLGDNVENSQSFQLITDWLNGMSQAYDQYTKAIEDHKTAVAQLQAFNLQDQFKNIKSYTDYIEAKSKLIQSMKQSGDYGQGESLDIKSLLADADKIMSDMYSDVLDKYSLIDQIKNEFSESFGDLLPMEVIQTLENMSIEQLEEALSLKNTSVIGSWEEFIKILQQTEEAADGAAAATEEAKKAGEIVPKATPEQMRQQAIDQYKNYTAVEDKVRKGQNISDEQFSLLDAQVQQMFADTADGMHKFIGDAETFYEKINNLKVDGFESAIKFVQDEIDKLSQYQNRQKFDYQTLNQEASRSVKDTNGVAVNLNELMAAQLDYIKTFGNASTQQMDIWEKNLDALTSGQLFGQPLQDFATQLAGAVSNIGIVDVEGQLATLNQILPGLSNQLADASKGPNGLSVDQIRQNAANEYNKYQSLIDATKDGGTISAQLFDSLDEGIQGFFEVAGVGIYKLKDDAQGFEQAVNKISLDSLRQGIEDLETARSAATLKGKGVNIQGASADQIAQYANDYALLKQQADFLSKVTPDDSAFQKQIDGWKQVIDSAEKAGTGVNKSVLNQIMQALDTAIGQSSEWGSEQQAKLATMRQQLAVLQQMGIELANNKALAEIEEAKNQAANQLGNYEDIQQQINGGETISQQQLKSLPEQVQNMFHNTGDFTYAINDGMEGIANAIIEVAKQHVYEPVLDDIQEQMSKLDKLGPETFNYDKIQRGSDIDEKTGQMNEGILQAKLRYLDALDSEDEKVQQALEKGREMLANHEADEEIIKRINEAYNQQGNQTDQLKERQAELKDLQEDVLEAQQAISERSAVRVLDEDVDAKQLENVADALQKMAENSDELDENLSEDREAAQDLAEEILRFDDAIEDVVKNYDDWMDALNSGSIQDQANAIAELSDAYGDLLGIDGGALSNEFLSSTENLQLMQDAINGDVDAYNELLAAAGEDIIAHLDLDDTDFYNELNAVQASMDAMNFQQLEVGANLDIGNFLDQCTQMINTAGMTAQQARAFLTSMGINAEVETAPPETDTVPISYQYYDPPTYHTDPIPTGGEDEPHNYDALVIDKPGEMVPVPGDHTEETSPAAFALKVTSATKSAGGDIKFKQASNGGGAAGTARRAPSGGGRGGGGGKKGGGGGKGKKGGGGSKKSKDKEDKKDQKQKKEKREDQVDIYHDVNKELNNIERALGRLQKKQDKLWGKQLLDNLNKQSALLEQHKQKLQEKLALQQKDLANKRKDLELLGATFDEYGNISNYVELVSKKQQILNKLIDKYNKLVEKYNKATSEKKKKDLEERIQKFEKEIKDAEKQLDDLENKVKDYDALQEDMANVQEQIEDDIQQQIQINIKKFRMSIEIRLEMGEAERDWNKFVREVMHHTDVIKDSPFDKIFQDAKQQLDDVMSYFDVHGAGSTLTALVNQMYATKDQIEQINATGWSSIYGDNNGTAMQDLQSDLDTLMSQMQDIESLLDNIDQAYLDTIDDVQDNFDKQIDDYEYVADLIEHDIDLLELLYGDRNYNAMNQYYTALERNQNNQLDALRKQTEFWKKQWQGAAAAGDTEAAKKFEENYRQALDNLNSVIEQAAETIQNKYINAIDNIFNQLDKKISGGLGTDYLDMQWDLMNKNAETYLDTINAAFAVQELQRKYNKAINDTQSIRNQQTLKKLMDEQLENLRNKEKISQYDVDRAEKLLQIEQARIALEDAQSSKTSLRLKRDSQGNYSYQYVSDADKTLQAQQKLNEAQNDLYNFDKQAYKANLDEMLAMWQEFQEKYRQIVLDTSLTEEQRVKDLALLREEYGEHINALAEKNLTIRQNLLNSAFGSLNSLYQWDITNYQQMSDEKKAILMEEVANYQKMSDEEKKIFMEELVPMWTSGIQKMTDKVAAQGGFIPMCKQAFEDIHKATQDYKKQLDDMAHTAGIDLTDVRSGVDELSMSFQNLIMDNDELINHMFQEISAIQELRMEAQMLVAQYQNVYQSALQAASAIHEFIQAQRAQAAAQAEMMEAMQQQAAAAAAPAPASASAPAAQSSGNSGDYLIQQTKVKSLDGSGTLTVEEKIYPINVSGGGGKKKNKAAKFDTGGYTGEWNSSEGKLAILHEKEQVLNQGDTQNLLNAVQILRDLTNNAQINVASKLGDLGSFGNSVFENQETLEQNVQISATFPNVNSKQQIEDAFNDLINLAAQRAMRNR